MIPAPAALVEQLAAGLPTLVDGPTETLRLVGIRRGGVWVAERLRLALGLEEPVGEVDAGMFRDDLARGAPLRPLRASRLPWDVEGRCLVLVDDVFATGRTARAAIEELMQFGRPARILFAVLVERSDPGLRELPIRPDLAAARLDLGRGRRIKLRGPEPLRFEILAEDEA